MNSARLVGFFLIRWLNFIFGFSPFAVSFLFLKKGKRVSCLLVHSSAFYREIWNPGQGEKDAFIPPVFAAWSIWRSLCSPPETRSSVTRGSAWVVLKPGGGVGGIRSGDRAVFYIYLSVWSCRVLFRLCFLALRGRVPWSFHKSQRGCWLDLKQDQEIQVARKDQRGSQGEAKGGHFSFHWLWK